MKYIIFALFLLASGYALACNVQTVVTPEGKYLMCTTCCDAKGYCTTFCN